MRKMKRGISMILCLAMLFVAMPIPSLAEGEEAPAPAEGLQDQAAPQATVQSDSQAMDQAETTATGQTETQATVQSDSQATDQAGTTAADQTETMATEKAAPKETNEVETTATDSVDADSQTGEKDEAEPNANATSGEKSNKTATPLDDQNETEITLTFPGKQDILGSDIVFVLDKSGASAEKDIFKQAKGFLEEIKKNAADNGIPVNVGVVLFNLRGNIKQKLTDLATGYDDILNAMNSSVSMGTNMHAGLLAAKEMLDADTTVAPKNKHVILISDGATYLYCKGDNFKTAYTRSFGDPKKQINPVTKKPYVNAKDHQGGIWEYQSREYNLPNEWKKFSDGTTNFIFSYAMKDPKKLGEYLEYYRQQDQDTEKKWAKDEYEYNLWSARFNKGRKTTPIDINAPANIDIAFMKTDDTFQAMVGAGYDMKVYFKNAADFDGTNFLKYLARESNNWELNEDFAELQKEIIDRIAKGSRVEDVVGKDFDFVDDPAKISLSVGGDMLQIEEIAKGKYGFGKSDEGYRFVLTYKDESEETLTLEINETIFPNKPVELKYHEKLVNVPTDPGEHRLKTNESATLIPKDSNGEVGDRIEFPVPEVTKTVEGSTPSTDLVVTFDGNGGTIYTDSPDGKAVVRKFVRYGEEIVILGAPEREGYKFLYWQDADGNRYNPGENYVVKDNHVFVAQWEEDKPQEKPQETPSVPRIELPRVETVVTVKIPKAGV